MTWILTAAYILMAGLIATTWAYRRFLLRPSRIDRTYRPKVALLLPVRGLDPEFQRHVDAVFRLDYPDYEVIFGMAERDDPAYPVVAEACARHPGRARLVLTGIPWTHSEKIHNLLGCYAAVSRDVEVLAFIDGDVEPSSLWLQRLVTPLADANVGAATGYRWLVATAPTLARIVATMTNAAGAVSFWFSNNVWGGTLAMRRETFERLEIPGVWHHACADDLALRRVLRKHGLRVVSVADVLGVSHQSYTWRTYWEFLVRQLIIARVYTPALWWQVVGLYLVTISAMTYGAFGSLAWLMRWTETSQPLWGLPLLLLYVLQGWLVIDGAQRAIRRRGERIAEVPAWKMPVYLIALVVGAAQVAASATRRTIVWRGVTYRLIAADNTEVRRRKAASQKEREAAMLRSVACPFSHVVSASHR